ncbi:MAG: S-methyl-5-thioribose-1-phosphate isomerase [Pseudomonadota bacterium]
MKVNGQHFRTIELASDAWRVNIIDQTRLPHSLDIVTLDCVGDAAHAIRDMQVRGAPLIGATAAYGLALAMHSDPSDAYLDSSIRMLKDTRPTAVNLHNELARMGNALRREIPEARRDAAYRYAAEVCASDADNNREIGEHGLGVLRNLASQHPNRALNIMTHCNAGALATVDWGTALAPVYVAKEAGIHCHVWVSETRPRNQGAHLTAWELKQMGVDHTLVVDNACGHLMQSGQVDICIVGTDRTNLNGDVCNKIGTYLKALAANASAVPFYVALPGSTLDTNASHSADFPIEFRDASEVTDVIGKNDRSDLHSVRITPDNTPACNPAFDVTPAALISGLITERGICAASRPALLALYPEYS